MQVCLRTSFKDSEERRDNMRLMCSELAGKRRRITIGAGRSEEGPRLGGRAPQECAPSSRALRYLVTFPLTADGMEEASLFVDPDPDFVFGGNAGKVLQGPQLEVVRHHRSRRCKSSPFDSPVSEHPLLVADPKSDEVVEDGAAVPYSGHKIGGRPYFVHGEPSLEDEVGSLLAAGYCHCLQLDFPGGEGDAEVSGAWPFGTGLLHVLCNVSGEGFSWRCFWET